MGELINGLPLCGHRYTQVDHTGRTICIECGDVLGIPEYRIGVRLPSRARSTVKERRYD